MTYSSLKVCPKCKADSIFLPMNPAAGYDGRLYGSRSEGFCNSPLCDQLLWYYPSSGRVTRRNVGQTLADYHDKQKVPYANLHYINVMRRQMNLPLLMEMPDKLRSTTPYKPAPLPLFAQFRGMFADWFWYIVAVLKSPFLGKLPSSQLLFGEKTINEMRVERGLDPLEVDNAE